MGRDMRTPEQIWQQGSVSYKTNQRDQKKMNEAIEKHVEQSCESCDSCCPGNKELTISCPGSVGSIPLNVFAFRSVASEGVKGCIPLTWSSGLIGLGATVCGSLCLSGSSIYFARESSKKLEQEPKSYFNFCCAFHGTNYLVNSSLFLNKTVASGVAASSPTFVLPAAFAAGGAVCLSYACYKQCCKSRNS